ncbi:hypothetical protein BDW62DRAFT_188977 [Aspergillus aurantiobrunneus]
MLEVSLRAALRHFEDLDTYRTRDVITILYISCICIQHCSRVAQMACITYPYPASKIVTYCRPALIQHVYTAVNRKLKDLPDKKLYMLD